MNIRPITTADTENCGRIMYEAFCSIDDLRNLPRDIPSPEVGMHLAQMCINAPEIYGFAAEDEDGNFIGSNFLWEHDAIRGVGPITIDPNRQSKGVGRRLMQAVIERGKDAPGIRLVQGAYNLVSMSLYTDLGFEIVEPLVIMEGAINGETSGEAEIRPLEEKDFAECNDLCRRVHGFERANELKQISQIFPAFVAVRGGRIVAYASAPVSWQMNHAVAETTEDMQDLLSGASRLLTGKPLSFLLPTRQSRLFRWCLNQGLRAMKPLTLMKMGEYQEPRGCFLPSVLY